MHHNLVLLLATVLICGTCGADEGQLYNHVGTIKGQVVIDNHPDLGRTPCTHCSFLIQYSKCKDALVMVKTDEKGQYKVRIGFGRWKVIMRDMPPEFSSQESEDMLSPKQPHYIDVKDALGEKQFDIVVHLPKR